MPLPFTTIKGVSERRRLPRLGKIRLGVKVLAKSGQAYPAEVDYFVVPPEVQKIYGPKPKALDVMFPVQDRGVIFPQALKWYGSGRGLKCIGDGERAMRLNDATGVMEPADCPCPLLESGQCARRAHLMVILPKVNMGGVYQIDMGSYNSIVDLNSGLDYVEAMVGRVAMVPLVLTRVPRETFGGGQRRVHYPLQVSLATNDIGWINRLRTETAVILERQAAFVLPAPVEENPALDEEGVMLTEAQAAAEGVAVEAALEPANGAPAPAPMSCPASPAAEAAASRPPAPAAEARQAPQASASCPPESRPAATPAPGTRRTEPRPPAPSGSAPAKSAPATDKQVHLLRRLLEEHGGDLEVEARMAAGLSRAEASRCIERLLSRPRVGAGQSARGATGPSFEDGAVEESYL